MYVSHPYLAYFLLKHDSIYIYVYVEPIEVSLVLLMEVIYGNVDKCLMCNICYEINSHVYSMFSVFSFLCYQGDCK